MQNKYTFLILLAFVIFYIAFITIYNYRTMKKQQQFFDQLDRSIALGDEVLLTSGICGIVDTMDENYLTLTLLEGKVKVSRLSVAKIIQKKRSTNF